MARLVVSTRDHIEKTLSEAYRKEIDQEENIWRSLPFFAATLALQLATVFQMIERLPKGKAAWWLACSCLAASTLSTIIALSYLAASIFPADFTYIAPEPELLSYAVGLDVDEIAALAADTGSAFNATDTLKAELARQYADATNSNRRVNQRRALRRSIAGLATLVSLFATIALVVVVVLTYVPKDAGRSKIHGSQNAPYFDCGNGECWRI